MESLPERNRVIEAAGETTRDRTVMDEDLTLENLPVINNHYWLFSNG